MAGDWIAWVKGLTKRREVVLMAEALGLSRRDVACCCMEWWEWCDSEGDFDPARDCHARGVTFVRGLSLIDDHVGVTGFGQAMSGVGWACENEDGDLMHPSLGEWTGSAAKERLKDNKRKARQRAESRKKRDKCPETGGTKSGLEKSREESIEDTNVSSSTQPPVEPSRSEFSFPLSTGGVWWMTTKKLAEYEATYADLFNLPAEFRKMRQWLLDNRARRPKSSTGAASFVTRWLNRTADRAKRTMPGSSVAAVPEGGGVFNPETGEIVKPLD